MKLLSQKKFFLLFSLLGGPEDPEPAPGFKKPRIVPLWSRSKQNNNQFLAQRARGSRERFFRFYVIIIKFTLRFSFTYVAVAGVRFSFTLHYRSGREAHRLNWTLGPVTFRVPYFRLSRFLRVIHRTVLRLLRPNVFKIKSIAHCPSPGRLTLLLHPCCNIATLRYKPRLHRLRLELAASGFQVFRTETRRAPMSGHVSNLGSSLGPVLAPR